MPDTDIARALRRGLRNLAIATAALYVVVAGVIFLGWRDANHKAAELRRDELSTTSGLCALRGDLKHRIASSEEVLASHPNGLLGVSAASIAATVAGQRRTVKALSVVRCDT